MKINAPKPNTWWAQLTLVKSGYFIFILLALFWCADMDLSIWSSVDQHWPREGDPIFASHFATWDAAHYLYLSEVGYVHGVPSCAFYPSWPLLIRVFSPATAGSHLIAGLILANGLSVGAWLIFYRLGRERWGEGAARLALVLLLAYPGALFFQFIYSESLFFLLLVVLWMSLERGRYTLAWGAAFLLPITRAVGLFCLFPILWHVVTTGRDPLLVGLVNRWPWLSKQGAIKSVDGVEEPEDRRTVRFSRSRTWWLLLAPLAGWGFYLGLMWHWTGDPFEGFEAQKHWATHSISNLWNVPKFIIGLVRPAEWHAYSGSLLDRCAFILLLYSLPLIWRLDKGLFVWAWVLGVVPAMSGTFVSFTRYGSCVFPTFIALAVFLEPRERRWPRWTLLAVFGILHIVLLWRFVNFRWAG